MKIKKDVKGKIINVPCLSTTSDTFILFTNDPFRLLWSTSFHRSVSRYIMCVRFDEYVDGDLSHCMWWRNRLKMRKKILPSPFSLGTGSSVAWTREIIKGPLLDARMTLHFCRLLPICIWTMMWKYVRWEVKDRAKKTKRILPSSSSRREDV